MLQDKETKKDEFNYSFRKFCEHRNIIPQAASEGRLKMAWEIYKNQYIEFCKENRLGYENFDK